MLGNVGASFFLAILLMTEHFTGVPLLLALVHRMSPSIAGRMACMYFAFNLAIAMFSVANLRWLPAWLVKICPPTPEQDLSRPMYLQVEALHSPETALSLVALEQMRLMRVFPKYIEAAREDRTIPLKSLHGAAAELSERIPEEGRDFASA
jgi:phosphate:Na+ symporter